MDGYSGNYKIKHLFRFILSTTLLSVGLIGIFAGVQAYPRVFAGSAQLEKKENVGPEEEIVINFSQRMIPGSVEKNLFIEPQEKVRYQWSNADKTLTITPENYWKLQSDYQIKIKKAQSILLSAVSSSFSFRTISYPQLKSFYPADGAKDVTLDIEDPMTAEFDKSLGDFKVKFTFTPFEKLASQLDEEGTKIKFLPENALAEGQKYEIKIYIKYKKEENTNYHEIYDTSFETFPPVPKEWDKNFTTRLEQARKFTKPKITEGKYIDINLKSQILTVFESGKLLDVYLVSTGKPSMPTPQGNFRISNKTRRAWSAKYGLYMPYWMALVSSGDFGIHELPEWPGGYKEGVNHLGTPVSHGCVRLGVGPAERVYQWADLGTPVVVHE